MKNITLDKNIAALRRKANITQDQLAQALNVSPQAVSKWETATSQPDTQTLPLIAEYFNTSIDYLFYGEDITYDDIYAKNQQKVAANKQMSKESYEEALSIFASAHHGISHGNLRGKELMYDEPSHISNENGLSLLSGRGYGAVITRKFFENISRDTAQFAVELLAALSNEKQLLVCMAIISMSDISYNELAEQLHMSDEDLRSALDALITANIVIENESKHKSLGLTYDINEMYHTCICILIATLEMERYTLKGISCCMGYGDYPINL